MADLQTLIDDGLIPEDIGTTGPASLACFDTLFGEAEGIDEAVKYLLFGPGGCLEALLACIPTPEPKFPAGTFIPLCFHQKTTMLWKYDNNTSIAPSRFFPSAFTSGTGAALAATVTTGAGAINFTIPNNIPAGSSTAAQLDVLMTDTATAFTGADPYGNTLVFEFCPPPLFRYWELKTCDLSQTYGDMVVVGNDGVTYTMTPITCIETECLVEGVVCLADGTSEPQWQDFAGNVVAAPAAADLAEFQASKCALPTSELPEVIAPDPTTVPPLTSVKLSKLDLADIIDGDDDDTEVCFPVEKVAAEKTRG